MTVTEEQLFEKFESLGISTKNIEHQPIFTVEEGHALRDKVPGMHCKNLFLKDKKKKLWLIVMPGDKRANLNFLEKHIGSARLSFGKPDLLQEIMGITPGSVTPFALMNDLSRQITVVLDEEMMKAPLVNYHPLRNSASTSLTPQDLLKFIKALGYEPLIANCGDWIEEVA